MALVLGATGVFVYLRFSAELDATINSGLRSRASDVAALVREADSGLQRGPPRTWSGAPRASPRCSTPTVASRTPRSRSAATSCSRRRSCAGHCAARSSSTAARCPGLQDESRLLAVPVRRQRGGSGSSSSAPRPRRADESLTDLLQLLLIGGPVALMLASLAAYGVAAAALQPGRGDAVAGGGDLRRQSPTSACRSRRPHDEVARLGKTLNEMLERLGEALEHERAFVADASHELRTPLAILRTELELAWRGAALRRSCAPRWPRPPRRPTA